MVGCPHCTRIRRFLACLVLSSLGPCSLILIMNKSFEIRKASLPIEYNMLDNKRKNKKKKKEGSKNVLGRALSSSPLVHKLKPNSSRSRLVLWLMVSKSSYFGHLDAFPILSYEGPKNIAWIVLLFFHISLNRVVGSAKSLKDWTAFFWKAIAYFIAPNTSDIDRWKIAFYRVLRLGSGSSPH